MKKRFLLFASLFSLFLGSSLISMSHVAFAFNQNNIIDDVVFDDATSMTAVQINNFLNSFPSSCISPNNGFLANDPVGYNPNNGYIYGGNVTAGQVIADSALAYGISPKVLLTTLQKEQSLVSGGGGCDTLAYAASTGYGCPDGGTGYSYDNLDPALYTLNGNHVRSVSGTCVNGAAKAGFSQQVIRAAWLLKFGEQRSRGATNWAVIKGMWDNSDDPHTCYGGPMTQGSRQRCSGDQPVYYDGYTTIDGQSVHMDDGATAALYWYTPHFHGNQSFTNIYNAWFGSTYAPSYSWQFVGQDAFSDASRTTEVGLTNLRPGNRVYLQFTAKNVGNQAWTNNGSNPIRVGSEDSNGTPDIPSPFCDNATWIACQRPATMNESVINPGETGTFTFWYKVPPNAGGTYVSRFSLLAEGLTWMNDPGMSFYTVVQPNIYSWQFVGQDAFTDSSKSTNVNLTAMHPGDRVYLRFQARNNGNVTWTNSGSNPIRAGTEDSRGTADVPSPFCDTGTWIACQRPVVMTESSVAPGAVGTFEFWYKAPSAGTYVSRFSLLAEGLTWMNDPGMSFYTVVQPNIYSWQFVGQDAFTDSSKSTNVNLTAMHPGDRVYLRFQARNNGNVTWTNSGSNPIRAGTEDSRGTADVPSPFCDTGTWIACQRPVVMTESSVAPGAVGTFEFWYKAPSAGTYVSRFSLLAEGLTWMNDPGMSFYTVVH